MKVLLLSDTHGCCDKWITQHAAESDEIWHAGDWGDASVADQLKQYGKVRGVYGNIDGQDIRGEFAEQLLFRVMGMSIAMIHIGGYPGKYRPKARKLIADAQPDILITGHSHILKVMQDTQNHHLHLNPGAAGIKGFHQVRTLLKFQIKANEGSGTGKISDLQVIEHPKRIVS
jgi:hypothetical protein